jgi:2'-5' RNA ligase
MQSFSQKDTLVHMIGDLPDGHEYSMKDWPLHVTLADVFAIQGDPSDLLKKLAIDLTTHIPIQVKVIGR